MVMWVFFSLSLDCAMVWVWNVPLKGSCVKSMLLNAARSGAGPFRQWLVPKGSDLIGFNPFDGLVMSTLTGMVNPIRKWDNAGGRGGWGLLLAPSSLPLYFPSFHELRNFSLPPWYSAPPQTQKNTASQTWAGSSETMSQNKPFLL